MVWEMATSSGGAEVEGENTLTTSICLHGPVKYVVHSVVRSNFSNTDSKRTYVVPPYRVDK